MPMSANKKMENSIKEAMWFIKGISIKVANRNKKVKVLKMIKLVTSFLVYVFIGPPKEYLLSKSYH
jgi:hypothetical protein